MTSEIRSMAEGLRGPSGEPPDVRDLDSEVVLDLAGLVSEGYLPVVAGSRLVAISVDGSGPTCVCYSLLDDERRWIPLGNQPHPSPDDPDRARFLARWVWDVFKAGEVSG